MSILRFFPVLAAFALAGCAGYHQGATKPTPMANVKTIAVPDFKNDDTLETRVEVQLANSIIKQIQQDGTYRIADEKNADAVLEGTLTSIQRRPERSVQGNTLLSREYSLILTVNFQGDGPQDGRGAFPAHRQGPDHFLCERLRTRSPPMCCRTSARRFRWRRKTLPCGWSRRSRRAGREGKYVES